MHCNSKRAFNMFFSQTSLFEINPRIQWFSGKNLTREFYFEFYFILFQLKFQKKCAWISQTNPTFSSEDCS